MRTIALVLISFTILCSCEKDSTQKELLFSEKFKSPYIENDLKGVIAQINSGRDSCSRKMLLEFYDSTHLYKDVVVENFIMNKDTIAIALIEKNRENWSHINVRDILRALKKSNWDNRILRNQLITIGNTSPDEDIRNNIRQYFSKICTYEEAQEFSNYLKIETSLKNRIAICNAIARYKAPELDSLLIQQLGIVENNSLYDVIITYALVRNNRYDLIPVLQKLKDQLVNDTRVEMYQKNQKSIESINHSLVKLENAKKNNLPIGKPLDWGLDN